MTTLPTEQVPQAEQGSRRKLVLVFVVTVLVLAGGAYWLLLRPECRRGERSPPSSRSRSTCRTVTTCVSCWRCSCPRRWRRSSTGARPSPWPSTCSRGRPVEEFDKPAGRRKVFAELTEDVVEHYEGEVLDLYVTEAVTQ